MAAAAAAVGVALLLKLHRVVDGLVHVVVRAVVVVLLSFAEQVAFHHIVIVAPAVGRHCGRTVPADVPPAVHNLVDPLRCHCTH